MSFNITQSIMTDIIFGLEGKNNNNNNNNNATTGTVDEKITQSAHGFAINEVISHNGTKFIKANVSNEDIVFGIVTNVSSSDIFTISKIGYIKNANLTSLLSTTDSDNILYLGLNGNLVPKSHNSIATLNKIPILKKVESDKGEILTSTQYLGFKNDANVHTLYYGKTGNPGIEQGTWKVLMENKLLKYYRYESSSWVLKTTLGASVVTDSFVLEDTSGHMSFTLPDGKRKSLLKPSIDGFGAILGNSQGRVGFVSKGENTLVYPKTANAVWSVDNPGAGTYTKMGTYYEENAEITNDEIMEKIKIYASTAASKFRFAIISASNDSILMQNLTPSEYNLEVGTTPLVVGENIINLKYPIAFTKGLKIKIALWTPTNTSLETGANSQIANGIYRKFAELATMHYNKKWRKGESYIKDNVVGIESVDTEYSLVPIGKYVCLKNHTSGNSFNTDLTNGNWEKINESGYTDSQIKTRYENNDNTNVFTDAEKAKLSGLDSGHYLGVYADLAALKTAHPTGSNGDTATVTTPNNNLFYWDGDSWEDTGTGSNGNMLKSIYDPTAKNADAFNIENMDESTNNKIFKLTERNKLTGIEPLAQVNNISDIYANDLTDAGDTNLHYHSSDRDRANHTGSQLASTISNFDTEVRFNTYVSANTNKVGFPEAPKDGKEYVRKDEDWSVAKTPIDAGWAVYNDGNTPAITYNAIEAPLVLNSKGVGGTSNESYLPDDVTSLWNDQTNSFNFSELSAGDMIDVEFEIELTAITPGQFISINLVAGSMKKVVVFIPTSPAGTHKIPCKFSSPVYSDMVSTPPQLRIVSTGTGTVKTNSIYTRVIKKDQGSAPPVAYAAYVGFSETTTPTTKEVEASKGIAGPIDMSSFIFSNNRSETTPKHPFIAWSDPNFDSKQVNEDGLVNTWNKTYATVPAGNLKVLASETTTTSTSFTVNGLVPDNDTLWTPKFNGGQYVGISSIPYSMNVRIEIKAFFKSADAPWDVVLLSDGDSSLGKSYIQRDNSWRFSIRSDYGMGNSVSAAQIPAPPVAGYFTIVAERIDGTITIKAGGLTGSGSINAASTVENDWLRIGAHIDGVLKGMKGQIHEVKFTNLSAPAPVITHTLLTKSATKPNIEIIGAGQMVGFPDGDRWELVRTK